MLETVTAAQIRSALLMPRIFQGVMLFTLLALVIACLSLGELLQQPLPESIRITVRTAFYIIAILTLPLTNLLRHIQLRLNQTMPLTTALPYQEAKQRYYSTLIVSMILMESVGFFGIVLFVLGDGINSLSILSGMACLGFFLYRPKADEFVSIVSALTAKAADE